MNSKWYKHYKTKEEKEARLEKLKTYNSSFKDLRPLVEELLLKPKAADYDCPAYTHKRSDMDGHNRALDLVLDLIKEIK